MSYPPQSYLHYMDPHNTLHRHKLPARMKYSRLLLDIRRPWSQGVGNQILFELEILSTLTQKKRDDKAL